jgi:hypothetical protein
MDQKSIIEKHRIAVQGVQINGASTPWLLSKSAIHKSKTLVAQIALWDTSLFDSESMRLIPEKHRQEYVHVWIDGGGSSSSIGDNKKHRVSVTLDDAPVPGSIAKSFVCYHTGANPDMVVYPLSSSLPLASPAARYYKDFEELEMALEHEARRQAFPRIETVLTPTNELAIRANQLQLISNHDILLLRPTEAEVKSDQALKVSSSVSSLKASHLPFMVWSVKRMNNPSTFGWNVELEDPTDKREQEARWSALLQRLPTSYPQALSEFAKGPAGFELYFDERDQLQMRVLDLFDS